jgi:hypothetical protein
MLPNFALVGVIWSVSGRGYDALVGAMALDIGAGAAKRRFVLNQQSPRWKCCANVCCLSVRHFTWRG